MAEGRNFPDGVKILARGSVFQLSDGCHQEPPGWA